MKYLKTLGLAVLAMAALEAFAGSASATTLTSPAGTTLGIGAKLKASSASIQTDEIPKLSCWNSILEGQVSQAGGSSETVRIPLSGLYLQCAAGDTITILKSGTLEIHTDTASADGNGRVTWSGAEFSVRVHRNLFGFPFTIHCIYYTENTPFGTLTGSKSREGKTAVLDISGAVVPVKETDAGCEPTTFTGSYAIETPDYLDVD